MKQAPTSINAPFLLAVLGFLTSLATVVNNMYSPAMPAIAGAMQASDTMVQLGLTASMAGLALGQIIIGTLSDWLGRRKPLLVSLGVYILASAALPFAPNMGTFIAIRLVQGLAAGGGIVISRSIATDIYATNSLAKALAVINVINGLMPIITPITGGALVSASGWQAVMWVMAAVGAVLLTSCLFISESLPADKRTRPELKAIAGLFARVGRNRPFVTAMLHQGGALAMLFCNIAATPFLLTHYGQGPDKIGLALGLNGIFTAIGAGMAPSLGNMLRGIRLSGSGLVIMGVVQFIILWFDFGLWPYEIATCVMLFFVGVTLTSSSAYAMDCARNEAGTASAVLGAVGFIVGAIVPPLTTASESALHSTALVYVCAGAVALAFGLLTLSVHKNSSE